MSLEFTNTLLATQNPDRNIRQKAESYLNSIEKSDFKNYINLLCNELSIENKPDQAVRLAGILLKNAVDAKNAELKKSLQNRWFAIPEKERAEIRDKIVGILCSWNKLNRDISAMVISKIASVELPSKVWLDLPETLVRMATSSDKVGVRCSAMKALGFLCEEVPECMADRAHVLLELVCNACSVEQSDVGLKLEALGVLYHSLTFVHNVFEDENKRNFILSVVFEAIGINNTQISIVAFDILARFADLFYPLLGSYLGPVLKLSAQVLQNSSVNSAVKLRAIEFWSTLAEIETDIQAETDSEERLSASLESAKKEQCQHLVRLSLPDLVPMLLSQMVMQPDETFEEDENNEARNSATCLHLSAICAKDAVVPHVLPFISAHIGNSDWHFQEAAVIAFGLTIEGPALANISSAVAEMFEKLLLLCAGGHPYVRDSASWSLSRVCKLFPEKVRHLENLAQMLIRLLGERPRIAANACLAIYYLADGANGKQQRNELTPFFEPYVRSLLECSKRKDSDENNLRTCCYEAINALVASSAYDSQAQVLHLVDMLIKDLKNSFYVVNTNDIGGRNQVEVNNYQALLIGSISSGLKTISDDQALVAARDLMEIFFAVLRSNDKTIFEEVLMAIGIVINKIGSGFAPYVESLKPFIHTGLTSNLGSSVCEVAVGIVSDLYRVVGIDVANQENDMFILGLLYALQSREVDRRIKPSVITCFGDIAMSLNEKFERYFDHIMAALLNLSNVNLDNSTFENVEFQNNLRKSIFETYSMILLAIRGSNVQQRFLDSSPALFSFIALMLQDSEKNAAVVAAALECIGDILDVYGSNLMYLAKSKVVEELIQVGKSHAKNEKIRKALEWALKGLSSLSF